MKIDSEGDIGSISDEELREGFQRLAPFLKWVLDNRNSEAVPKKRITPEWRFLGYKCPKCGEQMIRNMKFEECGAPFCNHIARIL